jgi:hypothetical protein
VEFRRRKLPPSCSGRTFAREHGVDVQQETIYPICSGYCLSQRFRQFRPSELGAAELIQLALQLQNCLRDRMYAFPIHDQAPPAPD